MLNNRPVVVLSNNDGCIISRSQEAKNLGIPMGAPYFKCKNILEQQNVAVYSSNYALYGDMSARVMQTIQKFCPDVEIYSIDEAFIRFSTEEFTDSTRFAQKIRATIMQWTGIPVSIGIGLTKTLAKIANKIGKTTHAHMGVFDSTLDPNIDQLLENIPINEVWGIGRQYTKLLNNRHIKNARVFKYAPDDWIKKQMTIVGLRTAWELRGIPCISLEASPTDKKSIAHTRSFGTPLTTEEELMQPVADYIAQAAQKLRAQKSLTNAFQIFITTGRHSAYPYFGSTICNLSMPTSDTQTLITASIEGLKQLFKPGYKYKKAGVILLNLIQEVHNQLSIFKQEPIQSSFSKKNLMANLDAINQKWGNRTVFFAIQGINRTWKPAKNYSSQSFTTCWKQLPIAKT